MTIDGIPTHIFSNGENGPCIYVAESKDAGDDIDKLAEAVRKLAGNATYTLVVYEVADWFADLSPWPAKAAFGEEPFAGKGGETLDWLCRKCIPQLKAEHLIPNETIQYTAGYSLSGLFALWALYEQNSFAGAACCSGSLWMDNWTEYAAERQLPEDVLLYLSLGSKEEKTKNPMMARVGDVTRAMYEQARNNPQVKKATLEWNKGGHFSNPTERLAKGIAWLIQQTK